MHNTVWTPQKVKNRLDKPISILRATWHIKGNFGQKAKNDQETQQFTRQTQQLLAKHLVSLDDIQKLTAVTAVTTEKLRTLQDRKHIGEKWSQL